MSVLKVTSALLVFVGVALCEEMSKPAYQYRYETEDVMKTAASGSPLRGYHVIEGGYYPESNFGGSLGESRFGGSSGELSFGGSRGGSSFGGSRGGSSFGGSRGGSSFGGSRVGSEEFIGGGSLGRFGSGGGLGHSFGRGGFQPSFNNGQRFIGRFTSPIASGSGGSSLESSGESGYLPLHHGGHHHQHGGYLDKKSYNDEKKLLNGEVYEKVDGKKGEVQKHDEEGFVHGKVALKKDNADKGHYTDEQGDKKSVQDGKHYNEDKHFKQEEKNEDQKKNKKGHRKGHVTKGFKTTHHKDESGKTETFFDEESDEGDNYSYDGKSGNFGENSKSAVKGEHENDKFNAGQRRTEGHYDNEHIVDKGNLDTGEYGQKKFSSGGEVYGVNKGIDQHSLLGQQEANRLYKQYPYHHGGHVPYYSHY